MTKIIEIIISPAGQTRLATKGFVGSTCRDASRFLEKALGVKQSEQLTTEFHTLQNNRQPLSQQSSSPSSH